MELELEGYDSSENRGKGEENVDDSDGERKRILNVNRVNPFFLTKMRS